MGALRKPDLPSTPLEPRDLPTPDSLATHPAPLDRLFLAGVIGAVVGAVIMVAGVAFASAATLWTAVALIALGGLCLRLSTKSTSRRLSIRD